jgi:hypothetical protein
MYCLWQLCRGLSFTGNQRYFLKRSKVSEKKSNDFSSK